MSIMVVCVLFFFKCVQEQMIRIDKLEEEVKELKKDKPKREATSEKQVPKPKSKAKKEKDED